jgi:hypothetical protein
VVGFEKKRKNGEGEEEAGRNLDENNQGGSQSPDAQRSNVLTEKQPKLPDWIQYTVT